LPVCNGGQSCYLSEDCRAYTEMNRDDHGLDISYTSSTASRIVVTTIRTAILSHSTMIYFWLVSSICGDISDANIFA
jgi:hypothetical protein